MNNVVQASVGISISEKPQQVDCIGNGELFVSNGEGTLNFIFFQTHLLVLNHIFC
jgi:hypothetical protein